MPKKLSTISSARQRIKHELALVIAIPLTDVEINANFAAQTFAK